jgi:hypothetical protein
VPRAQQDHKAIKASKVLLVLKAMLAHRDQQALKGSKALTG